MDSQEQVDGVIEKALRVMGARLPALTGRTNIGSGELPKGRHLDRLNAWCLLEMNPVSAALFVAECKSYLRDKDLYKYEVYIYRGVVRLTVWCEGLASTIIAKAPTEHEAWAKAVIATTPGSTPSTAEKGEG